MERILGQLQAHSRSTKPATKLGRAVYRLLLLGCTLVAFQANAQSQRPAVDQFSPDTVLVKFSPGASAANASDAHATANGQSIRKIKGLDVHLVRVPATGFDRALEAYRRNPNVEYAERNYRRVVYLPATTEGAEPGIGISNNFNEQWGLHNTGQAFGATSDPLFGSLIYPSYIGIANADIDAPEGWDISHGDSAVTIAVLDTGVACTHLDFGSKCVEHSSFVGTKSNSSEDIIGHGTHVAGIAAATPDNNIGIAGVGWNSSIAALKVCYEDQSLAIFGIIIGQCDDADVADAINHAVTQGYQVINMSFAGSEMSITLQTAIENAWNAGVVLVAGAGNDYTNEIMYPAGYANVIGVGSTDYTDNLSAFSTFSSAVSVLAPGTAIVSTVPGQFCGQDPLVQSDCYDTKSGTSMSSPLVAGLASLMIAHSPTSTNQQIRDSIQTSADKTGALGQNMLAWSQFGRINMAEALASLGGGSGPVADTVTVDSVTLSLVNRGKGSKSGRALVTVLDNLGNPVADATVTGSFSGSSFNENSLQVTTDSNGSATFDTNSTAKGGVSFTFCVDDVAPVETTLDYPVQGPDCRSI